MAKKVSPDKGLLPDNHQAVNAMFYAAAPADYFERRLYNLALVAGNREGLDLLIGQGLSYGGFSLGTPTSAAPAVASAGAEVGDEVPQPDRAGATKKPDEADAAKSAEHFVSAEAEVLAHHAGESLLRLYLAHEIRSNDNWPACPPLDLSRLRSFSEFKEKVAIRFGEDSDPDDRQNLDAVARVFHGTEILGNLRPTPPSPEAFERSLNLIEGYLRAFAHQHLSQAALYNAAKHGLALTPTEMGIQLGDGALLKVEGPAIQFLEVRDDSNGRRRWEQVTHWVRPDRQMALIWRTCELIETLWQAARYRYLASQRRAGYKFHLITGPSYSDLIFSDVPESGVVIDDMRVRLAYEDGPEESFEPG